MDQNWDWIKNILDKNTELKTQKKHQKKLYLKFPVNKNYVLKEARHLELKKLNVLK